MDELTVHMLKASEDLLQSAGSQNFCVKIVLLFLFHTYQSLTIEVHR